MPTIQEAVNEIKQKVEEAILISEQAKTSLIRSQKLIRPVHEAIKSELIRNGLPPTTIFPALGTNSEIKLSGFLKNKTQDIIVVPNDLQKNREEIIHGYCRDEFDKFGSFATERILSINVRSQLSSLGKNVDTLYERTFAESLNLHLRCRNMCLGELYLIPTNEYNAAQTRVNIKKYLNAFNAISNRTDVNSDIDLYKYEQVCLLIVDFRQPVPKIYSTDEELKEDGMLPLEATASITNLSFNRFIPSLLETYRARFPNLL